MIGHPGRELRSDLRSYVKRGRLIVRVVCHADRTEFSGLTAEGVPRIRLKALPVKGAANRELLSFLAKALGAPVRLARGATSRTKVVDILS